MARKDSALVDAFLSEFVKLLTLRFPDEIDFVLLFGSAARGEFRAGVSDVDLIIQVKRDSDKGRVGRHAEKLFWDLDRKHGTRLHEVCSTKRDDIFGFLEKNVKLYKPFEVLGPNDIDWSAGRISGAGLGIFAAVAPVNQFAKKVKAEGKVLYGRNIISEIRVLESTPDRAKEILIPYVLSWSALIVSPFFPDKALGYSIKAVLYSISGQTALLEASSTKKTHLKVRILKEQLGRYYSVRLAKEALFARINSDRVRKEWSYMDKVAFCFQAPIYIAFNSLLSVGGFVRRLFERK